MSDKKISELFMAIMAWVESRGAQNISALPGCWENDSFSFDGKSARVAVNGHSHAVDLTDDGFSMPPFTAAVMIAGWPAVLCDPFGGAVISGGQNAEQRLIHAFNEAALRP